MSAFQHLQGDEPGIGRATPPLYNLVYCSRAAPGVDDTVVQRIVATARRQNAIHGITGLLVFGSGIFFQWLEGPRPSVQTLLGLLRADSRHRDIVLLSETEEVRDRLFPDWDMERVTAEHIRDVLQDALDSATDDTQAQTLEQLLAQLDNGLLSELERG
jgi:Sensors of blue-light using FAD